MQIIHRDQLTISKNRQRKAFTTAGLKDLCNSIDSVGLLHPIVVRSLENGTAFELVAGERRSRAILTLEREIRCNGQSIPKDHLPVILIDELSPLLRMEAELHENILREDLTMAERAAAEGALHALRKAQNPKQTMTATAMELAQVRGIGLPAAQQSLNRSVVISRHLHKPEIANARSSTEAYRLINQSDEAHFETLLQKKLGKEVPHLFFEGTAQDVLPTLSSLQFDCIIADPPYGIDADEFGDAGLAHEYQDTFELAQDIWITIFREGYRVTKEAAHLYIFCDPDHFLTLKEMASPLGWSSQRTPIIWDKGGTGHDPYPGIGFKRTYEMFGYFWKGKKSAKTLTSDVVSLRTSYKTPHAAAKPVMLYQRLLERSCIAGDNVLDPCCGSGTIFPAASALSLRATGIEPSPQFIEMSRSRLYATE